MASDPVAAKSSFLCMYMSSHPDTLVAYAKHFGKHTGPLKSAQMTAIDTKSMTLKLTLPGEKTKDVVIPIEPPLKGYDDVKPRLLEMKAIAQESLGMIKTPIINEFAWPKSLFMTLIPEIFQAYTMVPIFWTPPPSLLPYFALTNNWIRPFFGDTTLTVILGLTIAVHLGETLFVYRLARKHAGSFRVGVSVLPSFQACTNFGTDHHLPFPSQFLNVIGTALLGFPILMDFRKRITEARINSVMKVE
ncbi:hypothetical protein DL96DRAFT_1821064 [Flagelloscypha sp. PMI_526]|nr:hypothetical protein DL96DRAFT_1821064 [Flagelloscypha sp. PMI_526]